MYSRRFGNEPPRGETLQTVRHVPCCRRQTLTVLTDTDTNTDTDTDTDNDTERHLRQLHQAPWTHVLKP